MLIFRDEARPDKARKALQREAWAAKAFWSETAIWGEWCQVIFGGGGVHPPLKDGSPWTLDGWIFDRPGSLWRPRALPGAIQKSIKFLLDF